MSNIILEKLLCTFCKKPFNCCTGEDFHEEEPTICKIDECSFCQKKFHHLDCMGILNKEDGTPYKWNPCCEVICFKCFEEKDK